MYLHSILGEAKGTRSPSCWCLDSKPAIFKSCACVN